MGDTITHEFESRRAPDALPGYAEAKPMVRLGRGYGIRGCCTARTYADGETRTRVRPWMLRPHAGRIQQTKA